MSAKRKEDKLRYEFLPAALEITETPAHPFGRIVLWSIIALIIVALLWSYFGRIDIVATARGRVVPDGSVKVVQSSAGGVTTAIKVSDGDTVKKGDLLVELDATSTEVDVASAERNLATARLERDVLKKLTAGESVDSIIDESSAPAEVKEDIRALAHSQASAHQVQRQFASAGVSQARDQLARENINLTSAQTKLNEARTNRDQIQSAYDQAIGLDKATLQSQLNTANSRVEAAETTVQTMQDRVSQARSSLTQAQGTLATVDSTNGTSMLGSVVDQDKLIAQLENTLAKAKKTVEDQSVYAPVSGMVMSLAVNTLGGVVTPGQQLAIIVPIDTPLVIEASLQNQDIGFVHVGQMVAIKLDTYSFQRYGTLTGKVVSISPDAVQDETTNSLTYKMKIALEGTKSSKDVNVELLSGMSLTSEIKTGNRRIISFFLDPLIAGLDEGFKSR